MPITRAKASARSKKGWQTRRKKLGTKTKSALSPKKNTRRATRQWAKHRLGDVVDNNVYQYHWRRPNGDKVRLTGFSDSEVYEVGKVLKQMDKRVRPEHSFANVSIEKRHIPLHMNLPNAFMIAGVHYPSYEQQRRFNNKHRPDQYISKKKMKYVKPIWYAQGLRQHGRILLPPASLRTGQGYHSLIHELGHEVDTGDFKYSHGREWKDAAKWKRSARHATGVNLKDPNAGNRRPGYTGRGYQSVSPEEDFAETFTRSLVGKTYTELRGTTYDRPRKNYMEKNIVYRKNRNTTTKIKRRIVAL